MDPTKRITSKDALQDDYFLKEPPRPSAELVAHILPLIYCSSYYINPVIQPLGIL